jgi:hypothetical protein
MKRTLLLIGCLLVILSVSAFATNTRVLTLGETNNILHDDANIWLFPSRINMYPDIAVAEFGYYDIMDASVSGAEQYGYGEIAQLGVHWKFNQNNPWVLGTYYYASGVRYPYVNGMDDLGGMLRLPSYNPVPISPPDDNQRIDLFYGRQLGDNQFGFHFGALQSGYKDDLTTDMDQRSVGQYNIDLGLTSMEEKLDLSAGLILWNYKDKLTYSPTAGTYDTYDRYKSKGTYLFHAASRYFYEVNSTYTLVPNAGIRIGKAEYEYYPSGAATEPNYNDKTTMFAANAGLGMQYTPISNVLAVTEFGLGYFKAKETYTPTADGAVVDEYEAKIWTIPYFKVGLEAEVFDWMDVRFGASSYWRSNETYTDMEGDSTTYKRSYTYPDNMTYLGFGFHWNRLHVDTYTDPQLFINGFNFISGEANNMNFWISALYEMF